MRAPVSVTFPRASMLTLATCALHDKIKAPVPLGRKLADCGVKKPERIDPPAVTVPPGEMRRIPTLDELLFGTSANWPLGLAATLMGPEPFAETEPVSVRMPVGEMLSVSITPLLNAATRTLLFAVTAIPCEVTGRAIVLAILCATTSIETTVVEPPPSVTTTNFPSGVKTTASAAIGVLTNPVIAGG